MGLKPKDKILVGYSGSENILKILEKNRERILKEAKILELREKEGKFDFEKEIKVENEKINLAIKKVNGKHSSAKTTKTESA
jgi:hypothetical protein